MRQYAPMGKGDAEASEPSLVPRRQPGCEHQPGSVVLPMKKCASVLMSVMMPAAVVALPSCTGVSCTANLVTSLAVTVLDSTGTELCDATVTARDGDYLATLQVDQNRPPCGYSGPYERRGTYTATARLDGRSVSRTGVRVPGGQCHVQTQDVTLTLG